MQLRPYQSKLTDDTHAAWNGGARNVVMRLDTGGGKTICLAWILLHHQGGAGVIAHREELVAQLSMALARAGIAHNLICSQKVRRAIAAMHIEKLGRSYFNPSSRIAVASVDTLINAVGLEWWFAQVTLWIVDEGHHVVVGNKWATVVGRFTNPAVRGLLPTATPKRADGKGLGVHADGLAHTMVEGPPMRWLIEQNYLTDYTIYCPESDLAVLTEAGATGDWSTKQLKEAAQRSHIVGDVVKTYLQYAAGKLGVTFATDIETATAMTAAYNAAGVRAETLSGKTEGGFRRQILQRFEARQLDQIVAVDIISEGFDIPAIEVGTLARPTQSLALYMQQFGRTLRVMPGKERAIIIDLAGNTLRHQGPPDMPRVWSLDAGAKRGTVSDGIPLRACPACEQPYPRALRFCRWCGAPAPEPASRSTPAAVDGDVYELDAETLARLRGDMIEANRSLPEFRSALALKGTPGNWGHGHIARHEERLDALSGLRAAMTDFARQQLGAGFRDREVHKAFFLTFGIDVLSAQALSRVDAQTLTERIRSR